MSTPESSGKVEPTEVPIAEEVAAARTRLEYHRPELEMVAAWHKTSPDALMEELINATHAERLINVRTKGMLILQAVKEKYEGLKHVPANARVWNVAENLLDGVPALRQQGGTVGIKLDVDEPKPYDLVMSVVPQLDMSLAIELRSEKHAGEVGVIEVSPYDGDQAYWRFYQESDDQRTMTDETAIDDKELREFLERFDVATIPLLVNRANTDRRLPRNNKWARHKGIG